jgi:hypothetical protein
MANKIKINHRKVKFTIQFSADRQRQRQRQRQRECVCMRENERNKPVVLENFEPINIKNTNHSLDLDN